MRTGRIGCRFGEQGGAQDIRTAVQRARTETECTAEHGGCGRHGLERARPNAQQRGAGRRDEFKGFVGLRHRHAGQQVLGGGGRVGHLAMRTADRADAGGQRTARDAAHAELVEREAGADDIGDRVPGADLMEMDGLRRFAVDGSLRFRQRLKDVEGEVARALRQRGAAQQAGDFGQPAMRVVMGMSGMRRRMGLRLVVMVMPLSVAVFAGVRVAVRVRPERVIMMRVVLGMNRNAQAVQARAACGFSVKVQRLGEERVDRLLDHVHVGAQSGQRRQNHVAAGSADTVKP
jgi:hypothetical protein